MEVMIRRSKSGIHGSSIPRIDRRSEEGMASFPSLEGEGLKERHYVLLQKVPYGDQGALKGCGMISMVIQRLQKSASLSIYMIGKTSEGKKALFDMIDSYFDSI
jgi:hypothetical protein